jgi:hypothetical protein
MPAVSSMLVFFISSHFISVGAHPLVRELDRPILGFGCLELAPTERAVRAIWTVMNVGLTVMKPVIDRNELPLFSFNVKQTKQYAS